MDLDSSAFRDDEIELLGAGEIADAGVGDVGGLVGRHHVIPHAHRDLCYAAAAGTGGRSSEARGGRE